MDNNEQKNLLEKIQSGTLKMRPKYIFILESVIFAVLVAALLLITVFLVSFVFFIIKDQQIAQQSLGAHFFRTAFPFVPVLIALLISLIAATLLKRFHFGYAHPFLYLLITIIFIVIMVSVFVHSTPFHQRFSCFTEQHQTPVFNNFYRQYQIYELCEHESGAKNFVEFWERPVQLNPSR